MFTKLFILLLLSMGLIRAGPKLTDKASPCNADKMAFETWQKISILPIKFESYQDEILSGQFESKLFFERLKFRLTAKTGSTFFQLVGKWEEEISLKDFLKKFKKGYWFVAYAMENEEKILCEAHQFKNLGDPYSAFGWDSDYILKSPATLAYWHNVRLIPATFHGLQEGKAYWLFLKPFNGAPTGDKFDYIVAENGEYLSRILKTADGVMVQIEDNGVFEINRHTIFHVIETREPRVVKLPGTSMGSFTLGKPKTRPKQVDRAYFEKNALKTLWMCFFDSKTYVLLRAVQFPVVANGNGKNNRNDKNKTNNGKNGKNLK